VDGARLARLLELCASNRFLSTDCRHAMTTNIRILYSDRKPKNAKARALLAGLLVVTVSIGLAGCANKEQQGLKWCEDNYFGTTLNQCKNHMRQQLSR
jgi:hypothetical protein